MHSIQPFIDQLNNKTLVILGLGKEGYATYEFFRAHFPKKKLWLIDQTSLPQLPENWQKIQKKDSNVEFSTHFDHEELQDSEPLVFKSPGIPPHSQLLSQASKIKAKFTTSTNLFFALVQLANQIDPETKGMFGSQELESASQKIVTIGVTGTKGKSTTTSLIHHILKESGLHSFIGGNIGTPLLSLWNEILDTAKNNQTDMPVYVALELSSHQLSDLMYSPNYAVILDITPEHLDYYKTFNAYLQAKSQICRFQTINDFAVYDSQHYLAKKIAHLADTTHLNFTPQRNIIQNWIVVNDEKIVDLDSLALIGEHTITNALPGVIIAKHLGISSQSIAKALQTFKPLPHRLELVAQKDGVLYYNDSLSTTPVATIAALKSFKDNDILLIVGGFDRGLDYSELAETIVSHKVKHLILLPDTGEIILEEVQKRLKDPLYKLMSTEVSSMKAAVHIAKEHADSGDIVLMSPASASFNMFKDYADRGDQFRKYVTQS